ncbi:MAG TPA: ATP-binding protein, partial [Thermohalobaculum sp.]|nr:ATP-binding protein [Thermohalobaculum sp.]
MTLRPSRMSLGVQLTLVLVGVTLALHLMLIAIDRINQRDQGRHRGRDLAPAAFAVIVPRLMDAPPEFRTSMVQVFSDPASRYVLGSAPKLLASDEQDTEFAAKVLAWAQRSGLPVSAVTVAERPAPPIPLAPPPGVASERSALFQLGEPPRTALFEQNPGTTAGWVTGEAPRRPAGQQSGDRPPPGPVSGGRVHTIAMELSETGQWLTLYRLERPAPINVSITKIIATILGTIAVAGLGILVGRRVMRPFRRLSVAADLIGRGERADPVAPQGPADVREIIAAFNRMGERVSQSVDYQIGLLRSIGHDLKGPLAAIRLMLGSVGPETTRQQIEDRLERAMGIINAIMAFSRATMRDGEMEQTDLAALLEAVVEEQAGLGHDVSLQVPNQLYVSCRFNAVERMLRNLVENAVKYGGSARASLTAEQGEAVIRIDDDGPGISEAELETVFMPFHRIATDTEGTGLGLAIVRSIAVDHGGSARLQNRPEGGLRA